MADKSCFVLSDHEVLFLYCHSMFLTVCFLFSLELVVVLKANAKKHVEDLVKLHKALERSCSGAGSDQPRASRGPAPRTEADPSREGASGVELASAVRQGCRGVCWGACP